ncbi:hypothetical protein FJK98_06220 [Micromonospora sp. HM134]|uniref:hypothetical protein n=1 Tax=Micromonospora sp. HM134 TaxID=2583243 RepID=UPI001198A32B|nr:hypothetical protein [Micromonospora sp. HM134]QDY06816.1 hypothetical protein FJK98_06220 [Micromonospora sp. HM134]
MGDGSAKRKSDIEISMILAGPNDLDDAIGKVVRQGGLLEEVMRECVALLGGLGNDVDVLLMGQPWDWMYRMAVRFQQEPVFATRRCNDRALPAIGEALSEADRVWKKRNLVVHSAWAVCPSLLGGSCEISASRGGKVAEGEFHVEWSRRGRSSRSVDHRHVWELEEIILEFETVRCNLVEGLREFTPDQVR